MAWLTLLVALGAFTIFAWGMARWFRRPQGTPRRMRFLGAAAAIGAGLNLASIAASPNDTAALLVGCSGFAAAAGLFLWALRAAGSERLAIAFSPETPGHVVESGPYRWVRHPIYASYLLAWIAGVIASTTVATVASLLVMGGFYSWAALEEDRALAAAHPQAYAAFAASRGRFLPRLARSGRR